MEKGLFLWPHALKSLFNAKHEQKLIASYGKIAEGHWEVSSFTSPRHLLCLLKYIKR